MKIKEDKKYQYPTPKQIKKQLDHLWENNDIQMIFWKKYFKDLKGDK